jgi:hypothetical protein
MSKVQRVLRNDGVIIRPFSPLDMPDMHCAYGEGSFDMDPGMGYAEFAAHMKDELARYGSVWTMLHDGKMIAMVGMYDNGYSVEPHVAYFASASKKAVLQATTKFLLTVRENPAIGACVVRCLQKSKGLFNRLCDYGVLLYVGMIPNGHPNGDEFLYCVRRKT